MAVNNRYEFIFYIQCVNSNPNGDPDMGNMPRIDPEDMHGYITDVAIKRRIRNYINMAYAEKPGMNIIMQTSTNINRFIAEAREKAGVSADEKGKAGVDKARKTACELFYDVRTFGGVLSTGPNAGQIRGPVQLTFARSLSPILSQDISITRMNAALDVEKGMDKTSENYKAVEDKTAEDKLRTMGRKQFISYGLYEARGFVSAGLSDDKNGTGFDEADLGALFEAILNMYEHDRSASKGMMSVITPLIIFRHTGTDTDLEQRRRQAMLGCAPAHKLFELIKVEPRPEVKFPRSYTDYNATVDLSSIPAGVDIGFMESPSEKIAWNRLPAASWLKDAAVKGA